ncbi:MAG TPA: tRNA (guanosine(37)-N1)-methyltransferase TrmD [Clostridiales bacterium]|nr:tRNA (guanosine(37)-N1)-methyltransferase TrmD [Clostridiales bacterium]
MRFDVLTLFPKMFDGILTESIIARGIDKGLLKVNITDIRDFANDKHKQVDDYPYGGGAGMVIKPQPVFDAVEHVKAANPDSNIFTIYTSPKGVKFQQSLAELWAREKEHLLIICGHYEGIDQRVIDNLVDQEVSIGDFILTGGELAAMVIIDAIGRLIPGVLGNRQSCQDESFSQGLLEYPQYTRPSKYRNFTVPEILLSGNHKEIENWRRKQAILSTAKRRPDLLKNVELTEEEKIYIREYLKE